MSLAEYLVVRMGKSTRDRVASDVAADSAKLHELVNLIKSGTKPQRMKGSWVLSAVHIIDSELLVPYRVELLSMLRLETVGGVKRELLRCFESARLNDTVADGLVLIAMDWVTDETQDLAVRYICYRVLKPLLKEYPELEVELQQRVEYYRSKFGRFP